MANKCCGEREEEEASVSRSESEQHEPRRPNFVEVFAPLSLRLANNNGNGG